MNFEELQKAWQSQDSRPQLTLDANLLVKEVEHNRKHFVRTIFWRDVREVGTALVLAPIFFLVWLEVGDWPWLMPPLACLGVAAFMLGDRWVQRKRKPAAMDPLRTCINASLLQVNHQIWLLKNVLWWYLLPLGISVEIVFVFAAWRLWSAGLGLQWISVGNVLGLILLYWGIYWLNKYAVRKALEPRRQELESLLAGLDK
jgi:hypothetical protein